jgi:carboxypeptidase T
MHRSRQAWLLAAFLTSAFALLTGAAVWDSFSAQAFHFNLSETPAPGSPSGPGPWVVRAYFSDRAMVSALAARAAPWEVNYQAGFLLVELDRSGYTFARELGFRLFVDEALTRQLSAPSRFLQGQVQGIPGYPCYRTVEETYLSVEQMVQHYPTLAAWVDMGDSWEKTSPGGEPGYDLKVLVVTNQAAGGQKPRLFIMASMHPREYAPAELATRFAEHLVQHYQTDADIHWLLDHTEIHLLLQANPDGRKKAEAGLSWRKNTNNDYCSATNMRGADLNRNFAFEWGGDGSSTDSCNEIYRGPAPASEPETRAVQDYLRSIFPDQRGPGAADPADVAASGLFLDLHSYSRLVLWPWGYTSEPAPNAAGLQTLGRKLAFFNGYIPQQSIWLYPTNGTTIDFAYGELGLPAYTFELGNAFFESCSAFENDILPANLPALVYAAKAARLPYMEPSGPDVVQVTALPTTLRAGESLQITARLDDTRFSGLEGQEAVQNIAAAEYYINLPPWSPAASGAGIPLAPLDGLFDSPVEDAAAQVDTSGLAGGRHILYLRGKDASGQWGPVTALFIHVPLTLTNPVWLPIVERGPGTP